MTLTRNDVEDLLRLRYEFTKERWGDATVDAWWELLGDLEPNAVRRRLRELVRGGATHVPPGLLAQGLTPTVATTQTTRRTADPDDCDHGDTPPGKHCPYCRAELLPAHDPRAIAAFERGLAQARAEQNRTEDRW